MILTGGASRRMGLPKEVLDAGGKPLLVHVVERVAAVCPCVVVGRPGQPLPPLPPSARRVDDPPEAAGGGPLVGLVAGLEVLAGAATLAYCGSVDAPLVTAAHVRLVLDRLDRDPAIEAVLPVTTSATGPQRHPLAAAVRVGPALAIGRMLVARGERRLLALFDGLATRELPSAELVDPEVLATCNTPDEWQRARLRLGLG